MKMIAAADSKYGLHAPRQLDQAKEEGTKGVRPSVLDTPRTSHVADFVGLRRRDLHAMNVDTESAYSDVLMRKSGVMSCWSWQIVGIAHEEILVGGQPGGGSDTR